MHKEIHVDVDLAERQWHDMVANLKAAGAEVEEMARWPGCPISSSPPTPVWWTGALRRQPVPPPGAPRRSPLRRRVVRRPRLRSARDPGRTGDLLRGAGDALPFGRSLLAGYRFRSDFKAHSLLAELLSIPVLSVELVTPASTTSI